jgi:hypothetical protein
MMTKQAVLRLQTSTKPQAQSPYAKSKINVREAEKTEAETEAE